MKLRMNNIQLFVVLVIILGSCAVSDRPGGGPPDKEPPVVVTGGETTPNKQTFFNERKIVLEFNEWIKVSNPVKEIFISPPLDYPLQVTDRGNKVILAFNENEVFKENTTYQINMGKSIKDLNEGNPLENFTFLFSTGAQLDDCSISGIVINELDGKAREDILVMLYDNLSDTVLTTLKPSYLTRTDKEGRFSLNNIRIDSFQIFALKDENVSYTYDQQNEEIAYLDSLLILVQDQDSIVDLSLNLFDEEDEPLFIVARENQKGLVKIVYAPLPDNILVNILGDSLPSYTEIGTDTIYHWHQNYAADSLLIELSYDNNLDTIKVRRGKMDLKSMPLSLLTKKVEILPRDTVSLLWSKPIALSHKDSIINAITISDSSQVYTINDLSINNQRINLVLDSLVTDSEYIMKIDSGRVKDWYGQYHQDSSELVITTLNYENLGVINLDIIKTDSLNYVLEVITKKEVVDKRSIITSEKITLSNLLPGDYTINLLQDIDGNGKWTGSSLSLKRRAEKREEVKLETLKSGWELESTINITEIFDATQSN